MDFKLTEERGRLRRSSFDNSLSSSHPFMYTYDQSSSSHLLREYFWPLHDKTGNITRSSSVNSHCSSVGSCDPSMYHDAQSCPSDCKGEWTKDHLSEPFQSAMSFTSAISKWIQDHLPESLQPAMNLTSTISKWIQNHLSEPLQPTMNFTSNDAISNVAFNQPEPGNLARSSSTSSRSSSVGSCDLSMYVDAEAWIRDLLSEPSNRTEEWISELLTEAFQPATNFSSAEATSNEPFNQPESVQLETNCEPVESYEGWCDQLNWINTILLMLNFYRQLDMKHLSRGKGFIAGINIGCHSFPGQKGTIIGRSCVST